MTLSNRPLNRLMPLDPAKPFLDGEIMDDAAVVTVIGRTHPFKQASIRIRLRAGSTVAELLEEALIDRECGSRTYDYHVQIDGCPIPSEWCSRVRPKPGTIVTFVPALGNGGGLKTALSLALAVAAIAVSAGALAPVLGPAFAAGTIGASLGATGVIAGGALGPSALFKSA
jgi:hypothetical protein